MVSLAFSLVMDFVDSVKTLTQHAKDVMLGMAEILEQKIPHKSHLSRDNGMMSGSRRYNITVRCTMKKPS